MRYRDRRVKEMLERDMRKKKKEKEIKEITPKDKEQPLIPIKLDNKTIVYVRLKHIFQDKWVKILGGYENTLNYLKNFNYDFNHKILESRGIYNHTSSV